MKEEKKRKEEILVVQVESHGVADEVDGALVEAELLVDVADGLVGVLVLEGLRVGLVEVLHPDEEVAEAALLEQAHEAGGERFALIGRHLVYLALLEDVGALDALELEVARHARVYEQLDEQAVGHQELGYEVDVPVAAAAQVRRRLVQVVLLVKLA